MNSSTSAQRYLIRVPSFTPRMFGDRRVVWSRTHRSDTPIRVGNLATIKHIHEDGGLSIKVDSGASLQLTPEQAQHVEYGYAIELTQRLSVDRVILSGEAEQIIAPREALSQLPANFRELSVYTSDGYQGASPELAVKDFPSPIATEVSTPAIQVPSLDVEGYAIEM